MTDELPMRRSFRLKDKPSPEYTYRNYLKKDYLPPTVIETNKKYNDIFESVVANATVIIRESSLKRRMTSGEERLYGGSDDSAETSDSEVSEAFDFDSDEMERIVEFEKLEPRLNEIQKLLKLSKREAKKEKDRIRLQNRKVLKKSVRLPRKSRYNQKYLEIQMIAEIINNPKNKPELVIRKTEEVDISSIPIKLWKCSCRKEFDQHTDCHKHIFKKHCDDEINVNCIDCGLRLDDIRAQHVCTVCGEFAEILEKHLPTHYRNSTSDNAIMECRFCVKQFKTVKEVMEHERTKHMEKPMRKRNIVYNCNECSVVFASSEVLTNHYNTDHIDINLMCEKIDELQARVDATKEECPFCRINMSSRKSFRAHLLKHHWPACKCICKMDVRSMQTDKETKKEIDDLVKRAEKDETELLTQIKKEVKEEVNDDDYPVC